MSEDLEKPDTATRRAVLRFGAASIPAFATLRASPAAAAASVMACQIPLTMSTTGSKWIKSDGTMVASGTSGAFPPLSNTTAVYLGQELRDAYTGARSVSSVISGKTMANGQALSSSAYNAHTAYIQKLSYGKAGYTCYASIYTSLT